MRWTSGVEKIFYGYCLVQIEVAPHLENISRVPTEDFNKSYSIVVVSKLILQATEYHNQIYLQS